MEIVFNSFSQPTISALGWTLVHAVWQGIFVAMIAFTCFFLLKNHRAQLRYNIGISMLGIQVIASIATFIYYYNKLSAVTVLSSEPLVRITGNVPRLHYDTTVLGKLILWLSLHLNELVFCWLIGATLLMIRFAGGWIYTQRLRANSRAVTDQQWRARFGVLIARLDITRSVDFRETAQIVSPMVIGAIRPVVLIPIGLLTGLSISQTEAILTHELAHIRRSDYLVNILQSFIDVVFFFHPALWWISERIRIERENCCDDVAVAACDDKLSLAQALVKVAEWQNTPRLAMAFTSRRPLLLQRIRRVMGVNPKKEGIKSSRLLSLVFITLLIGFSLYAVGQKNDKQPKKSVKKVTTTVHANATQPQKAVIADVDVETVTQPTIETSVAVEVSELFATAAFMDDSLHKKMLDHQRKMEALEAEMEPLARRMEEANLQMEKHNFEMERFEREIEKIEWKKSKVVESRQNLMEKRSTLFRSDSKSGQAKLSDSEVEKQLADIEVQIKSCEQQIIDFNTQIANVRNEATSFKADESYLKLKQETDILNAKMEDLQTRMNQEAEGVAVLYTTRTPRTRLALSRPTNRRPAVPPPPAVPAMASKAPIAPPPPPVPAKNPKKQIATPALPAKAQSSEAVPAPPPVKK
jgi:bla regulator protein BlaR1